MPTIEEVYGLLDKPAQEKMDITTFEDKMQSPKNREVMFNHLKGRHNYQTQEEFDTALGFGASHPDEQPLPAATTPATTDPAEQTVDTTSDATPPPKNEDVDLVESNNAEIESLTKTANVMYEAGQVEEGDEVARRVQELIDQTNKIMEKPEMQSTLDPLAPGQVRRELVTGDAEIEGEQLQGPPPSGEFFKRSIERGLNIAKEAGILLGEDISEEDMAKLVELHKSSQKLQPSQEFQKFTQAHGFMDSLEEFVQAPVTILGELTLESMASMYRHGGVRILGAGTAGMAFGPVTSQIMMAGAMGTTSYELEAAGTIKEAMMEAGNEKGIDPFSSVEALEEFLSDKELMAAARAKAHRNGLIVGIFDGVSMGIAGRVARKVGGGTLAKKMLGNTLEFSMQGGLGAAGEFTKQAIDADSFDDIQWGAVNAEFLGELGGSTPEVLIGAAVQAKKFGDSPKESIKRYLIDQLENSDPKNYEEFFNDVMVPVNEQLSMALSTGEITQAEAAEILGELQAKADAAKKMPVEINVDAPKKVEMMEKIEEKAKVDEKIKEKQEERKTVDESFTSKIDDEIAGLQAQKKELTESLQKDAGIFKAEPTGNEARDNVNNALEKLATAQTEEEITAATDEVVAASTQLAKEIQEKQAKPTEPLQSAEGIVEKTSTPKPEEKTYTVPSSNADIDPVTVDEETYKKWKKFDDDEKATKESIERNIGGHRDENELRKALKGNAMHFAAKKREVLGTHTGAEQAKIDANKNKLQLDDPVEIDGKQGKVVGHPFGRVKVEFDDGTTTTYPASKRKQLLASKKKLAEEAAKPKKKAAPKKKAPEKESPIKVEQQETPVSQPETPPAKTSPPKRSVIPRQDKRARESKKRVEETKSKFTPGQKYERNGKEYTYLGETEDGFMSFQRTGGRFVDTFDASRPQDSRFLGQMEAKPTEAAPTETTTKSEQPEKSNRGKATTKEELNANLDNAKNKEDVSNIIYDLAKNPENYKNSEIIQHLDDREQSGVGMKLFELAEAGIISHADRVELEQARGTVSKNLTELDAPKRIKKGREKLAEKKQNLKNRWQDKKNLGAIHDPRVEAEKDYQLYKALVEYAAEWVKVHGREAFDAFKNSLSKGIQENVDEQTLRDAFEGKEKKLTDFAPVTESKPEVKKGERRAAKRVAESEDIAAEVSETLKDETVGYEIEPNAVTVEAAESAIDKAGLDKATLMVTDLENGMRDNVRVVMGQILVRKLNQLALSHPEGSAARTGAFNQAFKVADAITRLGTELGRGIQAFSIWNKMSPEGMIFLAQKKLNKAHKDILSEHKADIDAILQAMSDADRSAVGRAINELSKRHKNVIKAFGKTPSQIKAGIDAAKKKFKKAMGNLTTGGLSPEALEAIGEFAFYTFLGGVRNLKVLGAKIKSEFGVGQDVVDHVVTSIKTSTGKTIEELSNVPSINDVIVDGIRKNNLKDALVDTGLTEATAEVVAKAIKRTYNSVVKSERKKKAKSSVGFRSDTGKVGNVITKMAEKDGTVERGDIETAVLDQYGYDGLNDADKDRLIEMAEDFGRLPEGVLKNEKSVEILNFIADRMGDHSLVDTMVSIWYASILSGLPTQIVNAWGNLINTFSETSLSVMQEVAKGNGRAIWQLPYAIMKGWSRGWTEAGQILGKGSPPNKKSSIFSETGPLERLGKAENWEGFGDALKGILSGSVVLKYVPRFMSAVDTIFYYGLYEMRANQIANRIARDEGKKGKELRERVAEILNGGISKDEARANARTELQEIADEKGVPFNEMFSERDVKRRASEMIDEKRAEIDPQVVDDADRLAAFGTYNYPPTGIVGMVAKKIAAAGEAHRPIKFVVPFTNIVANVINQQLDYSPLGVMRALGKSPSQMGSVSNKKLVKSTKDPEWQRQLMKGIIGTTFMVAAFRWAMDKDEDEQPRISGRGPRDYNKRVQLLESGWKPYSIKMGGRWVSYQNWPTGFALALIGNVHDSTEYDKLSEEELYDRALYGVGGVGSALINMSFLKGMADLFGALGDEKSSGRQLEKLAIRSATGFWPFPNFFNYVDRAFNPTIYEANSLGERIQKSIPVFRHHGLKPDVTTYGEDAKYQGTVARRFVGIDRFVSPKEADDPVIKLLRDKKYFWPGISRSTTIYGETLTEDQLYKFEQVVGRLRHEKVMEFENRIKNMDKAQAKKFVDKIDRNVKKAAKGELIRKGVVK